MKRRSCRLECCGADSASGRPNAIPGGRRITFGRVLQADDHAERMLFAVEIVGLGFGHRGRASLPALRVAGSRAATSPSRRGARGVGEEIERVAVEDVERDRAGRGRRPRRRGDGRRRCRAWRARDPVDRLGDFQPAILRSAGSPSRTLPPPVRRVPAGAASSAAALAVDSQRGDRSSGTSGASRTIWQRERIVGSRPPERMGDQHEHRARRRLLEILQQRVGGVDVHVVGGIDDDDTVAAVMRGHGQEAVDAPDLVDGHDGLEASWSFRWTAASDAAPRDARRSAICRNSGEVGSGAASS